MACREWSSSSWLATLSTISLSVWIKVKWKLVIMTYWRPFGVLICRRRRQPNESNNKMIVKIYLLIKRPALQFNWCCSVIIIIMHSCRCCCCCCRCRCCSLADEQEELARLEDMTRMRMIVPVAADGTFAAAATAFAPAPAPASASVALSGPVESSRVELSRVVEAETDWLRY